MESELNYDINLKQDDAAPAPKNATKYQDFNE